jgi:enoyl-[acyl-carrier protein] reductase/trans-2-enoyl-CoA reductase (NAD+)
MKEQGNHEDTIDHIHRLFATQLAGHQANLDEEGRIRLDDVELSATVQDEVRRRWPLVSTDNLDELADLPGFRQDFLRIFGFGIDGVDYDAEQDPTLGRAVAD